ncbi:hypothetical protein [Spirosoma aerolatum]|uniref:hypothetical protein n=1 Tax=Spirosoma aerolatum TaxID=1211326 RepID=UPI0009AD99F3|nr:hypothetical protein [Spirosoma aerolatum]
MKSSMPYAARCLAVACLLACPFVSSVAVAMPQCTTSVLLDKPADTASSVTRTSASKPESPASIATSKDQKGHDKQTISRCWKRIMGMAREVSHAHRNNK